MSAYAEAQTDRHTECNFHHKCLTILESCADRLFLPESEAQWGGLGRRPTLLLQQARTLVAGNGHQCCHRRTSAQKTSHLRARTRCSLSLSLVIRDGCPCRKCERMELGAGGDLRGASRGIPVSQRSGNGRLRRETGPLLRKQKRATLPAGEPERLMLSA